MREILSKNISPEGTIDILFKIMHFVYDALLLKHICNIECLKHKINKNIMFICMHWWNFSIKHVNDLFIFN